MEEDSMEILEMLEKEIYAIEHDPHRPTTYKVRLVVPGAFCLDNLPSGRTRDIVGHGRTLEDAAKDAFEKRRALRPNVRAVLRLVPTR
jgi:hypothetical protein